MEIVPTRIGWPYFVQFLDLLDDIAIFGLLVLVDDVGVVLADHFLVGGMTTTSRL
jgi:hypothetical protein